MNQGTHWSDSKVRCGKPPPDLTKARAIAERGDVEAFSAGPGILLRNSSKLP